jgi:APA family basic amino acid/polyamine antiporter
MDQTPKKELTLFDSTCLIVGIIIGAGIYETAPDIARSVQNWWGVPLLWITGGLLSLAGALCYAELATTYPRAGGDFVYLSRAYGRWAGFLFGWIQLVIVRPGDIALMAFIFARYARQLYDPLAGAKGWYAQAMYLVYACAAVVVLTLINLAGVRQGKWTQNILTVVKTIGLAVIIIVGLTARAAPAEQTQTSPPWSPTLPVAMIMVLFTYGGWNEMAYVAAEVKDPKRNILRALILGTVGVMVLYLLANASFLHSLGHEGMGASAAVGVDAIKGLFGEYGSRIFAVIICISALGAINGLIFAGSRISYAVGKEHKLFGFLGGWHGRRGTPVWALVMQGIIAVVVIIAFGSFERTILYTAAAVYCFYFATSASVIVLRHKDPKVERPFKVTGYPLTPIVFAAVCGLLIYGGATYRPLETAISLGILLTGMPVYGLTKIYDAWKARRRLSTRKT